MSKESADATCTKQRIGTRPTFLALNCFSPAPSGTTVDQACVLRGASVQQISKVVLVLVTALMHSGGSVLSCAHGVQGHASQGTSAPWHARDDHWCSCAQRVARPVVWPPHPSRATSHYREDFWRCRMVKGECVSQSNLIGWCLRSRVRQG